MIGIDYEIEKKDKACRIIGYQNATVLAPIKVKPKVKIHDPKTFCIGKPVVIPGAVKDHDKDKKDCEFTVAQKIVVAVPIEIESDAFAGDPSIKCGCSESKDGHHENFECCEEEKK
ncbi:MAG TPA: hypothetical protein GXX17_00775 [Clostridiales bacterium]|nr:hypothetical protein [Clostridiales bacterium]